MISPSRLKKILRMPPRQLAAKVWSKARAALALLHQRRRDQQRSTYLDHHTIDVHLGNDHALAIPYETLRTHEASIVALAAKYRCHQFDLLGSGWAQVEHGMNCRGVESFRYDSGPAIDVDRSGVWLEPRINPANVADSQRVWRLVDDGYRPIDWHLDFKSGQRWREDVYYRDIRYAHRPGVDVKVPWELTRMQHLPMLALAFALGGDERDPREFRNQVLDFIAVNPPRYGVNWTCTMDVAIRTANWLLAYDLFIGAGADFDAPFLAEFTRSVYQHGLHIVDHLEWNETMRGNHYLADIVGLLFVATHLSANTETDTWLAFAVQQLLKESATQFHEDGSNFEASTSYHRLSGEMLAYATALILGLPASRQQALHEIDPRRWQHKPGLDGTMVFHALGERLTPLPEWYVARLARAGEFTRDTTHPDGVAVQIGDNDSGRFIKLGDDHPLDPRPFVAALDGLFDRENLRLGPERSPITGSSSLLPVADVEANPLHGDFELLQGRTQRRGTHNCVPPDAVPRLERACIAGLAKEAVLPSTRTRSTTYPCFGLYRLGQPGIDAWVRCGSVGQNGNGGHAHDDQLSFELSIDDIRLIVDPGTYLYTPLPSKRNRFRSAAMHNTLTVIDHERHAFQSGTESLFCMHDPEPVEVVACSETEFVGRRCHAAVGHRRTLRVEDVSLHGIDECTLPGRKRVHFHLAPGLCASVTTTGVEIVAPSGRRFALSGGPGTWQVSASSYSAGYGLMESNQVVTLDLSESRCAWRIGRSA